MAEWQPFSITTYICIFLSSIIARWHLQIVYYPYMCLAGVWSGDCL